jgi:hypothetical protein
MDGVSWGFSDRQATNANALRKTIALSIRRTGQIAEASLRFIAPISE